jgi:valyl-tRNA synthetase
MIMMGLKFMGRIPFRHVFINGLVRDIKRRKMSKSEGNIIDPLEMIDRYGTDALRFTLAALAIPGMDLSLSEERMAGYQAFANKIWNASRFVLMNLHGEVPPVKEQALTLADRWIRSRLTKVISELNEALEQYKFYEAADKIYHFIWHEFCDWYIELAKPALKEGNASTRSVLAGTLDSQLRLLHPFMPFLTEEIWQHLPQAGKSLTVASFPVADPDWIDEDVEARMRLLQAVIVETRTIRAENRIPPSRKIPLWLRARTEEERRLMASHEGDIQSLANVSRLEFKEDFSGGTRLLKGVAGPYEIAIPIEEDFDLEQEKGRLERELAKIALEAERIEERLRNPDFVKRAPGSVVEETKKKLLLVAEKKAKIEKNLSAIGGRS